MGKILNIPNEALKSSRDGIFELLGITDERDQLAKFLNRLKFVADSLAIWSFIETRDDEKYEEPELGELLVEWNPQLDDIIAEIQLIARDFKQVTCRVNVLYPDHNSSSDKTYTH